MSRQTAWKGAYLALRLGLGGAFVSAGVLKLLDPMAFAAAIDGYGLVSWATAKMLARVLPVVEVAAGAGLILDIRSALGLIVAQLLVFMGVLAWAMHMGLDVDCGCFGPSGLAGGLGTASGAMSGLGSDIGPDVVPDSGSGGLGPVAWALIRDAGMLVVCGVIHWLRRFLGVRLWPQRRDAGRLR
ncbi:MAG: MauE/DoxX family redox-associated membrane protein [Pseudomonadota bacterium]